MVSFSFKTLAVAALTASFVSAQNGTESGTPTKPDNGVETPESIQPGLTSNCAKFVFVAVGDSCAKLLTDNDITIDQFYAWNTGIGKDCTTLWGGAWHCVAVLDEE